MVKGFRQIALLTTLSRVFGLVRDMTFGHLFGAGALYDAWVVAFRIPNLARRLFGEGAASASFIPVYSRQLLEDPKKAARLANTVVTVIFVLLCGLVLIGWGGIFVYKAFRPQTEETERILSLSATMLPYMVMVCTVAILAGVLNVHRHFAAPAAAPIVLNIFIITTAIIGGFVFDINNNQLVFAIAVSVLAAGVVQLLIQFYPLRKKGLQIRPAWDIHSEAFRKILILMGPMIIGLTATQINTLCDDLIAWLFSGSADKGDFFNFFGNQVKYPLWRGSVTHLYLAQRLYQFPLGVLGISLATAIFPVMSGQAAQGDTKGLFKTIRKGIQGGIFVAIPAMFGFFLVGRLLISVLFEHGEFKKIATDKTAITLGFYAIGLCGYFCQQIVTRAFFSLQDSKIPAKSALFAVLLNILLNLTLIWFMGTSGLALSTAICSYCQVIILLFVLRRRFSRPILEGITVFIVKTSVASVLMWGAGKAVLFIMKDLPDKLPVDIARLCLVIPICAGVYYVAALVLRIPAVSLIRGMKRPEKTD